MVKRDYRLHNGKKGAAIGVRITPRASTNEIAEILNDGTIRIRLTSSPSDEKMDQQLTKFLAEILSIPASKVEVVVGDSSRDKLISIIDLDAQVVHKKILEHLS
ncbi:MAG: DUF167 domain-containing protein [Chloroflexota bacterium]